MAGYGFAVFGGDGVWSSKEALNFYSPGHHRPLLLADCYISFITFILSLLVAQRFGKSLITTTTTTTTATMILTDDSTHSTFTRNGTKKLLQRVPDTSPRRSGPTTLVQFNEDANEYYENYGTCAEDCVYNWYAREDYVVFRHNMRETIQQALLEQEHCDGHFFRVLRTLFVATRNVDYILNDVSEALTEQQEEQICQLYHMEPEENRIELLGLEYQVVDDIRKESRAQRDELQDVVYDVQVEYSKGMWTKEEVSEELRESCISFTQASHLFAQLLAKAQRGSEY